MSQNKVLATLILSGIIFLGFAQVDTAWVRRYESSGADTVRAMAIDDWGNDYVAGSTIGDTTGTDWTIIKYNLNGDQVWVRNFITPGNYNEGANAIAVANSGNIYVTGYTMSSGLGDFLTIRYSPTGETIWTQRRDGPEAGFDLATSITLDNTENIYVAGYTEGAAIYDYDIMIIKYDSAGNKLWDRIYNSGANRRDEAKTIKVDRLGNVYVTGTTNPVGSANYDYLTVKYSPSGDFRWAQTYNGPADSTDIANSLVLDDSGYIYVTGTSLGSGTGCDFATIKYTPLSETVWVRRYNNSPVNNNDEGYGIAVDNWGNVYVTGISIGSNYDYLTIKYNHQGAEEWTARYNNIGNDIANGGIAVDAQGNVYITGKSESTGTSFDYVTIKYNPLGVQQWLTRYNGLANGIDQTQAIAVDGYGNVYVTGNSQGVGTDLDWVMIKYFQPGYLIRDVGTTAIVSPPPVVAPGTPIVPACSVYNYGDTTETYLVRMRIGSFYEDTVRVTNHLPGTYEYLTFTTWNANPSGIHIVSCSTELLVDGIKRNDKKTSTVIVGSVDVEVFRILAPTGTIDTIPVVPRARIRNNSSVTLPIPVTFKIFKDTMIYFDSRIVNLSGNGAFYDVPFDTFYLTGADTGDYTTEVSVFILGDTDPSNDTKPGAFSVIVFASGPGWQAMPLIPPGLSGKRPKSGSCIAGMRDNIYFLKASNTQDFHIYNPDAGTWLSDTMPLGTKDAGDGKKPKKGAAMTAYQQGRALYILRGNNTVGFWCYQADTIGGQSVGWHKLKNIPLTTKKCKDGSGLVSFHKQGKGYIFAMKGAKTNEFYIYHIDGDSWTQVSSPPLGPSGKSGYKNGSCLTYDGDEFVYVLKGNYGDFHKYSIDGDSWHQLRQYDYKIFLNREGKKKKPKGGAALVYYEDNIYLLKGGNTLEFWRYEIASDSWIQMNPAPTWDIPLGPSGKKVKDGGCMTIHKDYFYVAKGKNTDEFYRHTLPTITLTALQPTNEGIQEETNSNKNFRLMVKPNPANKLIVLRYNLPIADKVNIKLYDITGSLVKTFTNSIPTKDGTLLIDTKSLPAGVYIIQFKAKALRVNRKIAIEK